MRWIIAIAQITNYSMFIYLVFQLSLNCVDGSLSVQAFDQIFMKDITLGRANYHADRVLYDIAEIADIKIYCHKKKWAKYDYYHIYIVQYTDQMLDSSIVLFQSHIQSS